MDKGLYIYSTASWSIVREAETPKRANAVVFDPSGANVLAADKFGDVVRLTATPATDGDSEKPVVLLGHVSILCDIEFTHGDRPYVLTCDRDEKLRVSRYPNSYNIQSFCLGHTAFVTSVAAAKFAVNNAVTGSGDGTVRLWDVESGELLQTVVLGDILAQYRESEQDQEKADRFGVLRVRSIEETKEFAVLVEDIPAVIVFPFANGALGAPQVIDIARAPTDLTVASDRLVVSYVPAAEGVQDAALVSVLKNADGQYVADDELNGALSNVRTLETNKVPAIQSIFVWGSKNFIERTNKGDQDDDE
ncbi:tRNA (guanine-N(7)-)-methyltransferase non-catalytic subunit trm82 [Linderina pennispora]|nr:tRNA (guanine-N(7)-)-methyltransferase non-catalytic subunit trm82 [Linderina pennispora]